MAEAGSPPHDRAQVATLSPDGWLNNNDGVVLPEITRTDNLTAEPSSSRLSAAGEALMAAAANATSAAASAVGQTTVRSSKSDADGDEAIENFFNSGGRVVRR